jgi:hypothetical protein
MKRDKGGTREERGRDEGRKREEQREVSGGRKPFQAALPEFYPNFSPTCTSL